MNNPTTSQRQPRPLFAIVTILLVLFFASCTKEKASLKLVEGQDFKVAEVVLLAANANLTLTPTDAFLRFQNCNGNQNSANSCELTAEIDGTSLNLTYQANGESGNEFVTIRRGQDPDGLTAEISNLLDALTFTFAIDQTDARTELSCTNCPVELQGQTFTERVIRLE